MENSERKRLAARALGRSYGALFFSCFGGCWLLLYAYAFGMMRAGQIVSISLLMLLLVGTATSIQRRAKKATIGEVPTEQRKRDDRTFGIINAVQWIVIFLIFTLFPKLGLSDLTFPAVLLVVGVHFFFMPPSYRHRSNFVTGAALSIWAIVCPLFFKGEPDDWLGSARGRIRPSGWRGLGTRVCFPTTTPGATLKVASIALTRSSFRICSM